MDSPQPNWPAWRVDAAAARSYVVHRKRSVLPVAGWIVDSGVQEVRASQVTKGLSGQLPTNKVLEALSRLCEIGALDEMPGGGAPHPRVFRRLPRPAYWHFVAEEVGALKETTATDQIPVIRAAGSEG